MDVAIIETSGLGDRSYLVSDRGVGVIIDPQRDIDRVLNLARQHSVRITHVLETHIHNDYITGGLELSRSLGADYDVPAGDDVDYERTPAGSGDVIDAGPMTLQVMNTPGHTHHHVSYILRNTTGETMGVFTGGSMLYGTTGRTDLVGDADTEALTHAQFHSVRRLADELPPETQVYPTHGFGGFCGATRRPSGDSSTIAEQRTTNPALTQGEQTYVNELLAGLSAYPAYYAHMGAINKAGPAPLDLSLPEPVHPAELSRRIATGEWVVDLRNRNTFAAGHLSGSLGFELSESFVTYLGWLYDWGAPLNLIGRDTEQIADDRRELVRIGIDDLCGAATGDIHTLGDGTSLRSYRVGDFAELANAIGGDNVTVLDVRQRNEYEHSHIRGALNIPLHELVGRIEEVPTTAELWIHCASGYRSSIAASMLDQVGRTVVLVDDTFDNAENAALANAPAH